MSLLCPDCGQPAEDRGLVMTGYYEADDCENSCHDGLDAELASVERKMERNEREHRQLYIRRAELLKRKLGRRFPFQNAHEPT